MESNKMNSEFYSVYIENDRVATEMPLAIALVLAKAIYAEYYNEKNLRVGIERYQEEPTEENFDAKIDEDVDNE